MSTSTSHPSTGSPDIPFHGFVETTADALRLIQAARQGVIPRITRRLNEEERATIVRSGAVFVFSVEESGIRRWTEGLSWSASRIAGNFLLYRELASRNSGRTSYTGKALQSDSAFSRRKVVPKESDSQVMLKPNGLVKKTITVCADGTQYHLISYYTDDDFRSKRLQRPIRRPDIVTLGIPSDLLDASNFRYPPRIDVNGGGSIVDIQEHHDSDSIRLPQYRLTPRTASQPAVVRAEVTAKPERQSSSLVIRTSRRPRAIRPAKPRSPVGHSPTQSPAIPDVYRHTGGIGESSPTIPGPSSTTSAFFPPGTVSPTNASFSDSLSPREPSPWRPQGTGVLDRGGGHPIPQRYPLPQLNESHQIPGAHSNGTSATTHHSGCNTLLPAPAALREYGSRHSYPSTPSFSSSNYSSPGSTHDQHHSNHQNNTPTTTHANYNEPVQSAYPYQRMTYNAQPNNISYPLAYDTDYNQYNSYGYYMPFPEQEHRTP